jgi:hypothetical protein
LSSVFVLGNAMRLKRFAAPLRQPVGRAPALKRFPAGE